MKINISDMYTVVLVLLFTVVSTFMVLAQTRNIPKFFGITLGDTFTNAEFNSSFKGYAGLTNIYTNDANIITSITFRTKNTVKRKDIKVIKKALVTYFKVEDFLEFSENGITYYTSNEAEFIVTMAAYRYSVFEYHISINLTLK